MNHFTQGEHAAFESLMQETEADKHFDSGSDGKYPECRSCRYHIPGGFGAQCRYDRCPYRKKKGGHKSRRDRWES